jgi:hypothetical protein
LRTITRSPMRAVHQPRQQYSPQQSAPWIIRELQRDAGPATVFIIGGGYRVRRADEFGIPTDAGVDVCIIHGGSDVITTSVGPAVGTGRLVCHCNISGAPLRWRYQTWFFGQGHYSFLRVNRVQMFRLRPARQVSASIQFDVICAQRAGTACILSVTIPGSDPARLMARNPDRERCCGTPITQLPIANLCVDLTASNHVNGRRSRRVQRGCGFHPSLRWSATNRLPLTACPAVTTTLATTPGMGAPIWASLPSSALGRCRVVASDDPVWYADRAGWPLSSRTPLPRPRHWFRPPLAGGFPASARVDFGGFLGRLHTIKNVRVGRVRTT